MTKDIASLLHKIMQPNKRWQTNLLNKWPEIIGDLCANVTLEKIYNDTLVLGVPDACWLQELNLMSNLLRQTINQNLDQPRIKHLRFKQRGIKPNRTKTIVGNKENKHIKRPLNTKEAHALEKISDPELAQALKQFLMRCTQEK